MRLTQPMFLSFLSFKNQKPDLSKLGSETYTRKMNTPLFHNRICKVCSFSSSHLDSPSLAYADNNQGDDQGDGRFRTGRPDRITSRLSRACGSWGAPLIPTTSRCGRPSSPCGGRTVDFLSANGTTSGVSAYTAGGQVFRIIVRRYLHAQWRSPGFYGYRSHHNLHKSPLPRSRYHFFTVPFAGRQYHLDG